MFNFWLIKSYKERYLHFWYIQGLLSIKRSITLTKCLRNELYLTCEGVIINYHQCITPLNPMYHKPIIYNK